MVYEHAAKVDLVCYEKPEYYNDFVKAIDECGDRASAVKDSITNLVCRIVDFSSNLLLIFFVQNISQNFS